ncbi:MULTISPECIES: DsrE family protein [Lacticaseibacillus]|uniref:DsrE family protein n=2 Tax=Lacticaseibacillus TaxID=2759736 RepID=A0AAN1EXM4_LACCA|nr:MULTISPECIES: DsrE family protein [Lacticaseibacillus]ARY90358.1 sulfur reduction protein DsrE [Lacticaseibacillus casei]KAB1969897.1 sulfur reduction protein DsrE [Lacticaseibacillus casei]WLV80976.1 DsrE family protein [Lacticaseibacillus sp. NCIMB 15473]WNX24935.1 DsrE family protein [Lacticaseibacillus casei]WNX27706.1 DsrE family protein [Lacticaseibacillus casei]
MALKAIFHLDTTERWPHLASNLTNFLMAEPDADLEVLVNGDGITVYFDQEVVDFIAAHPQVKFFACHNSLAQRHLDEKQLPATVAIVPVGVVKLAQAEAAGYAYIKP